jgi:hypothetical protein
MKGSLDVALVWGFMATTRPRAKLRRLLALCWGSERPPSHRKRSEQPRP